MKTIVTHFTPDLDAITSIWLIKRFLAGWEDAKISYTAAGTTLNDEPVDSDADILHVDTGYGVFDHHHLSEDTCAARRILEYLKTKDLESKVKISQREALERIVDVVNDVDHFREVYFPNPESDYYDFGLVGALDGWKLIYGEDYDKYVDLAMSSLDGIYKKLENKIWAEREIAEKGIIFETGWGKALAVETVNDEVVKLGQRRGYRLVIRKDPKKGHVRIKSPPDPKIDLEPIFQKLKVQDPTATWFLHISHHMVLNGSMKNPKSIPSKLGLKEIIEIIKNINSKRKSQSSKPQLKTQISKQSV